MPPREIIPPTDDPSPGRFSGLTSYVVSFFVRLRITAKSTDHIEAQSSISDAALYVPPGEDGAAHALPAEDNDNGRPNWRVREGVPLALVNLALGTLEPEELTPESSLEDERELYSTPSPMDVDSDEDLQDPEAPASQYCEHERPQPSTFSSPMDFHSTEDEQNPFTSPPHRDNTRSGTSNFLLPVTTESEEAWPTDPNGFALPALDIPCSPARNATRTADAAPSTPQSSRTVPTATSNKRRVRKTPASAAPGPGTDSRGLPLPDLSPRRSAKNGLARPANTAPSSSSSPTAPSTPRTPSRARSSAPASPITPGQRRTPRNTPRYSDAIPSPRSPLSPLTVARIEDEACAVLERLFPWQRADLDRIVAREREEDCDGWNGTLVKWDTGMGKTILTIALVCVTRRSLNMPTLILCQNTEMMKQWHGEFEKFASSVKVKFYHGDDTGGTLDRLDPEKLESFDVVLATYHQLKAQANAKDDCEASQQNRPQLYPFLKVYWGRVVADESHFFRNPKGKCAAAMLALQKRAGLLLSATPIQNYPCDLYSQFKFLGRDYAELKKANEFVHAFAEKRYLPAGVHYRAGTPLVDILREACIFRPKISSSGRRCIDLPRRINHDTYMVSLSEDERELYRCTPDVFNLRHQFSIMMRLRQACLDPKLLTTALKPDEEEMAVREDPDVKEVADRIAERVSTVPGAPALERLQSGQRLPRQIRHLAYLFEEDYVPTRIQKAFEILNEILSSTPDEKIIVYCHFKRPLDTMSRLLTRSGFGHELYTGDLGSLERCAVLSTLETDNRCRVLLMTIQSGGTGLNITSCNNVILLEPWWNPYQEEQAIGRVHRIGQKKPVHVYRIVAEDTIETERMVPLQNKKWENIESLFKEIETV